MCKPWVTLQLRVTPRARRNAVTGRVGEAWKVAVTAPPADGRANDAVIELLAETLGVKRRQVVLIAGAACRDKVVRVTGLTGAEVAARLSG
jgi:uncharacterized protein (TIGR00251 family)